MVKKKLTIKRKDVSTLRSKNVKPFNAERFLDLARKLKKAVKEEEKKYGPTISNPQYS